MREKQLCASGYRNGFAHYRTRVRDPLLTDYHHKVERSLVCAECGGRFPRSGLTQDIKIGSYVFQCDVPHQLIAQRQVGSVSVYYDGMGYHILCLWHGIPVWQHISQSTTAARRHRRDMTLNSNNKQTE